MLGITFTVFFCVESSFLNFEFTVFFKVKVVLRTSLNRGSVNVNASRKRHSSFKKIYSYFVAPSARFTFLHVYHSKKIVGIAQSKNGYYE